MESFYGGKQGRSYKIVQHFDSVYDMVTAFNQGGSYTDVGYDEYVIIDTIINRNARTDLENGLLYRRGYNYSEPFNRTVLSQTKNYLDPDDYRTKTNITLYADTLNDLVEYTEDENGDPNITSGNYSIQVESLQIPKYKTLYYRIKDGDNGYEIEYIIDPALNAKWKENWQSFVTNPGGGAEYVGQIVGPKGDNTPIKVVNPALITQANGGQIQVAASPGKNDNGTFNDKITYTYANLLDTNGNIYQTELAFDIPYTVFVFQAESISPYDGAYNSDTKQWSYEGLISEQSDSLGHPYYKHYDIKVPKGIHGRDVAEIGIQGTTENQNQKWYYETKTYDAKSNPEVERHIVGNFRNIRDITRDLPSGDFYVNYTDTTTRQKLPLGQIYRIAYENDTVLVQYKDVPGTNATTYYNASIQQTHEYKALGDANATYWVILGNIYAGTHLFGHFNSLTELQTRYPYGFGLDTNGDPLEDGSENRAGWLATVGDQESEIFELYAYDYRGSNPHWYRVQAIGAAAVNEQLEPTKSIIVSELQPADNVQNDNGIWLVEID